ncbi:MAG: class I SAM-dependent methyltransferase [Defluviitaleaceae bacterium]|nr:class I SAM-dependent methyltransferase [Defluviitaleaceae bacterium]
MDENTKVVRDFYDSQVVEEWNRIPNRPEFLLTCRMLDRYIKPGDTVLDIGGGPGRYSLYLAAKGCDVTLFDLSPENTKFGAAQADREGLAIKTITGDACGADKLVTGQYDHVLLMGPMYHLLDEADRVKAVNAALSLLKPGGIIFVSFISSCAGITFYLKHGPEFLISTEPSEIEYREAVLSQRSYGGDGFTRAFFIEQSEILPFMARFSLEKLHLFGQEGLLSLAEKNVMSQPQEVINAWLDFCEKLWDRDEFLSWAEHPMYVGRKR